MADMLQQPWHTDAGRPWEQNVTHPHTANTKCLSPYSWANSLKAKEDLAIPTDPCDGEQYRIEAMETAQSRAASCVPNSNTFVALLQTCAENGDLYLGTQVHDDIVRKGLLENCSDALVCMYAKCGAPSKAQELLDTNNTRNVLVWTAVIACHAKQGESTAALKCFERMLHAGLSPDPVTCAWILRVCGRRKALNRGMQIHNVIIQQGLLKNHVLLGNALIDMYAKCGAIAKAQLVLESLLCRDVVSWNSLITGYVQQGQGKLALACLDRMRLEGITPDTVTFACILKACGMLKVRDKGEELHQEISRSGLLRKDVILGNTLVDMYVKCGALAKAQLVLDALPLRNVVSWTTLIAGYAEEGHGKQALRSLERMQFEGVLPNARTFASILKACGSIKDINRGAQIHDEIARRGLLGKDVVLGNSLVDMYAKCGALTKAARVLQELPSRDIVSWNTLITGYAQHGKGEQAFKCLKEMEEEGFLPNAITYTCILKACGRLGAIDKGERIHHEILSRDLMRGNIELGNALVDMYAKCGDLVKARQVLKKLSFPNVASWNALLAGYTQKGQGDQALICFEEMQSEGLSPDVATYTCILNACAIVGAADKGAEIHDDIVNQGLLENNDTLGNALVDMYAKCGALEKAKEVLQGLASDDVVSWSSIIAGYVQVGQGEQALDCFERMQHAGVRPDQVTFTCILRACSIIQAVDKGKEIHDEIFRVGLLECDIVLGNALVDMYAKCGALAQAKEVLDLLPFRDIVSWNTLMAGYVQQGQGKEALICYEKLHDEGLSPNAVTFSCLLNACNHLGLVGDGYAYFLNMSAEFGIMPDVEHYTTMADLFGRTGHLDKAANLIQEMPQSCDSSAVWFALLSACQKWGDAVIGRWAFEGAVRVDRSNSAAYILMGNIYAVAGMQEDAKHIERMYRESVP